LPPVLAPFVWLAGGLLRRAGRPVVVRAEAGRRIARLAAFGLPSVLLLGGWILWVYRTYEMLSPTTMGGYHLVQHTGEFFEYLPDEQATLRDTYLKYRDAQIAARGTQANAIWDAIPELSEVSGLSFFGLSAELQRLSLQLIRQHPLLYLANVVEGWIDFWKAPVYWDSAGLRFLTKYGLPIEAIGRQDDAALNELVAKQIPPEIEASLADAGRAIDAGMARAIEMMPSLDPTLEGAARTTLGRMQHDLQTLHGKMIQAAKKRNETLKRQFVRVQALAFPGGHAQERAIGFVSFLNQYGPALVERLEDELPLDIGQHWIVTV